MVATSHPVGKRWSFSAQMQNNAERLWCDTTHKHQNKPTAERNSTALLNTYSSFLSIYPCISTTLSRALHSIHICLGHNILLVRFCISLHQTICFAGNHHAKLNTTGCPPPIVSLSPYIKCGKSQSSKRCITTGTLQPSLQQDIRLYNVNSKGRQKCMKKKYPTSLTVHRKCNHISHSIFRSLQNVQNI